MSEMTFEEMAALGVPVRMLARRFNMPVSSAYTKSTKNRAGFAEHVDRERAARVERIRDNITAAPSVSMFGWQDRAA